MKTKYVLLLCAVFTSSLIKVKAQEISLCNDNVRNEKPISQIPGELNKLSLTKDVFFSLQRTQPYSINTPSNEDYLTKSRHQKTIAWIMLGGGTELTALGLAVSQSNGLDYAMVNNSNHNTAGTVLAVVGITSAVGSIPLFISAAHNKKKAAELTFNIQQIPTLCLGGYYNTNF